MYTLPPPPPPPQVAADLNEFLQENTCQDKIKVGLESIPNLMVWVRIITLVQTK